MGAEELLNPIKEKLSEKISVRKVCLFGSRATGQIHEDSDYDIAVISEDFQGKSFTERQSLVRPLVREVLGLQPLDVVCYTPDEYEDGKTAFLPSIIEDEGVAVA